VGFGAVMMLTRKAVDEDEFPWSVEEIKMYLVV